MKVKFLVVVFLINMFFPISASQFSDEDLESQEASDITTDIDEYVDYETKEVSVSSSITYALMQMFTHETHHYKSIEYESLYKHYKPVILGFIDLALSASQLDEDEILHSTTYTIVGEDPIWNDEPLFDRLEAQENLKQQIKNFIDSNETEVYSRCVGPVLQSNTSRVVIAPGCCDLQIHKNCFQQCRNNGIKKCLNPFCTKKDWVQPFYTSALKKKTIVHVNKLYDANCPLCMQPLKAENIKKRKLSEKKDSLIIEADGTTIGGKHTRFL